MGNNSPSDKNILLEGLFKNKDVLYVLRNYNSSSFYKINFIDCKMDRENTYIAFKLKSRNFYMRMQIVLV